MVFQKEKDQVLRGVHPDVGRCFMFFFFFFGIQRFGDMPWNEMMINFMNEDDERMCSYGAQPVVCIFFFKELR